LRLELRTMSGNEADAAAPGGLRSKWRTIML